MENVLENSTESIRLGGTVSETVSMFGPLADLIGTWVGSKGWNLVALPQQNKPSAFTLLVQPYTETLTITPLNTPTPNRGTHIIQQVPTLLYNLKIHDTTNGSLLHAENGTWLLLPDCPSGFNIARQASVPHGNSVLALGSSSITNGAPQIPTISTLPFDITGAPLGYTDPYIVPTPGIDKTNPNATLLDAIKNQTILSSTNLVVNTNNKGGITSIPFITQNANAAQFNATYWIETVKNPQTGRTFLQLQYSQTTILQFMPQFNDKTKLINWPHVNINTLVKQ